MEVSSAALTTSDIVLTAFSVNASAIPEPSAVLLGGFGMLALLRRRRA
jgi:MYXO-CTERM domain-containing protein